MKQDEGRRRNAFEFGDRKVIPAVLVYLKKSDRILMIHRNTDGTSTGRVDFHQGRWNGIGGKCEADESPLEAALREVKEEAGLSLSESVLKPIGVLQFPNFKPKKNEDWNVTVFCADLPLGDLQDPKKSCEEGDLHWISVGEIQGLNLWPGDRLFIPMVLEQKPFIGTIWYRDGDVMRNWIQRI